LENTEENEGLILISYACIAATTFSLMAVAEAGVLHQTTRRSRLKVNGVMYEVVEELTLSFVKHKKLRNESRASHCVTQAAEGAL